MTPATYCDGNLKIDHTFFIGILEMAHKTADFRRMPKEGKNCEQLFSHG